MFQRQLRKEFSRAIRKAALVTLLPLSLATSAGASAQDTSVSSTLVPTEQAVMQQDTLQLRAGEVLTIPDDTQISFDSAETRYPFLKDLMTYLRNLNSEYDEDLLARSVMRASTVHDQQKNIEITVVSVEGPLTCGASQCYVGIFVNNGDGYKQAFASSAPLPVKILKENDEISFYFCSYGDGRAQWTLKDDKLVHQGNVVSPRTGPACPRN